MDRFHNNEMPEQGDVSPEHLSLEHDFEKRFAEPESLELPGGTGEVIDISPEKAKDETPIFLAPGWGCDLDVYKGTLKTLFEQERRVVSLNHPRHGGDLKAHSTEEMLEKYPTEELRKALNILSVMEQKGIPQADVIAHSEGAINTTIAATLHPEKFRNIVFFGPAGLQDSSGKIRSAA